MMAKGRVQFSRNTLFLITLLLVTGATEIYSKRLRFASRGFYRTSVEESSHGVPSRPDLQVGCVNQAGEPVPTVRYSITGGNSGPFHVDARNGSVLVRNGEIIDYDQGPDFYVFTIECIDRANPEDNDSVHVNITILPVNEYFPEINVTTTISVNVLETLEVGTALISTVQPSLNIFSATDRDRGEHGRIRYSLSRSNQESNSTILSYLYINRTTGALVVIQSLDIDDSAIPLTVMDIAVDVITVTVCDRENDRDGTGADSCPNIVVVVQIESVNEFNPKFLQKVYNATIPESEQVGTGIIEVNCTDRDIGRGEFQVIRFVQNDDQSRNFSLEDNSIIRLMHPLDYEKAQLFNITLVCYDNDGKNDTAQLIINVEAINEHQPHFTQDNYTFTLNRLSTVGREVGQVEAIDDDLGSGGDISYALQGDSENFGIRSNGAIYLKDAIFATESDSFIFTVIASDGQFNDTTQVHISVTGFLNATEIGLLVAGVVAALLLIISTCVIVCYRARFRIFQWCKKRLKPEPRPVAGIELHRRENAQENQYVENPHYDVPLRPRQANPNNTSAASEGGEGGEAGGGGVEALREQCDEAGQGGEAHEGGESGEVRGEEHLNPHYYNRLKHSFNQQMEGERPITKVIKVYGTAEGGHTRVDNDMNKHKA